MTASSSASATSANDNAKSRLPAATGGSGSGSSSTSAAASTLQASGLSINSSAAFQQVKQTQASLARLYRVHGSQQQTSGSGPTNNNQSSPHTQQAKTTLDVGQPQQKATTFVDCLIRRFKNCFSEDFCTVPMFVVGNLSPGSDGTHLILPPCVSLGRQNINRFSSPKNLRLMNSIRESCRSVEELDLGDNKLTDLIEIYKILQYTPNLRFLNLSENDLSRAAPVAMASSTTTSSSSSTLASSSFISGGSFGNNISPLANNSANSQQLYSTSSGQRTCLAPINQNQLPHCHQSTMGTRRHSTLGQSSVNTSTAATTRSPPTSSHQQHNNSTTTTTTPNRNRQTISRVAEARRLAAANALAQSKKTSSRVASKLAESGGSLTRQATGSLRTMSLRDGIETSIMSKQTRTSPIQRHQANSTSTMHLARSLSSLSAKDIRTSSSATRLAAHRSSIRTKETNLRGIASTVENRRSSIESMRPTSPASSGESRLGKQSELTSASQNEGVNNRITTSTSHQKLFVEPIVETEDVDMSSEQQKSPNSGASQGPATATTGLANNLQQQTKTNPPSTMSSNTGTVAATTLRSMCNTSGGQATNFKRTFESIKALALNNTGCQWKVVCSILSRMPNLEELHLSLNNYERIDLEPSDFKHHSLRRLYLCNNPKLTNWEELDKLLIAFPSLEALSIANCSISQIPDNLDRAHEWRKLCGLNINGWPIKEWPVVERLNQLPSLVDLKCRNLDVLNSIDEPRHHLIARLPKLQRLNGSEIEEREHAEKAFLRFFMVNSHLERPPRFHELMQIYGEISHVDVDVDLSPPSQARVRVIYLNRNHYCKEDEDDVLMSEDFLLKLMDNVVANDVVVHNSSDGVNGEASNMNSQENMEVGDGSCASNVPENGPVRLFKDAGQEVVALDVDLRQSVRKFKSSIASLFGLNSQNLILYYIDHEMVGLMGPELIKHNQKKLWNYNVQDGDQFIVEDR
uniref:Tubulin-specific chaperone cofactor E-like protein n=1 Tax=Aceria tosichella TaxID=561515 RepID=A0A6G1SLA5_9ACAR